MNNYYIDPSAKYNGDGSIDSPYNSWAALSYITPNFPFTINIKRGTSERGNFSYGSLRNLVSNSSEQSFIKPYGLGANPVIIQDSPNIEALFLVLRKTTMMFIDGMPNDISQNADILALSALASAGDISTDVIMYRCNVSSNPYCMQAQYVKAFALVANRDVKFPANGLCILECNADYMARGAMIVGNYNIPTDIDTTTNVGDRYRTQGAIIDGCSFTNMRDDGAILNRCTSPEGANNDTTNPLVSKISNCYYSSWRSNTANTDNYSQAPAVSFWSVYSNRTVIEYCISAGSYASKADRMAFDFDIMTWDCVIRYCYSCNNAGGLLLFISNADGDGSQTKPSAMSDTEWYITRRWGQGNNVMHNCISYNDGTTRAGSASGLWMSKFRLFGYASNCVVKNCTIIDVLSSSRHCFFHQYAKFKATDGITSVTLDSNIFHFRNLTNTDVIRGDTTTDTQGLIKLKNNNIYSEVLGDNAITIPSYANSGGNTQTDPKFEYLPKSSPSTFDSARLIKMMKTSAYYGVKGFIDN